MKRQISSRQNQMTKDKRMKRNVARRFKLGLALVGCAQLAAGVANAQFPGGGFPGGTGTTSTSAGRSSVGGANPIGGADISYDAETRQLIVVTDDKTAGQIKDIVKNLDRPPPQVLIKVVFLEATH
ncbi:MAG: hypothetical protein HY248_06575, partial [Fimbriimonas ginsengisoli]|nr:hypothetical protein [Fimbriimonas ginsengisoli]